MSPEQALKLLNEATSHPSLTLNRQQHMLVVQALQTLEALVAPKKKEEGEKDE